ncbi:hypothetical protein L7F22_066650 [Adiantum nelumboides]|nr:hypothetical protein [Adiantum nelumboides]
MPTRVDSMPLRPMMGAGAFAKWGIDFVEPIQPPAYRTQAQYIIVATDYLTKWAKAKFTRKNDARTTAAFLYENVFTRYEFPIEIVSDRGTYFFNEVIEYFLSEFMVIHNKSAPYHPQANGQAEHTNKILSSVLTKVVSTGRTDWKMNLHAALWAYRVSFKTVINATPFNLVYGIDAMLPIEFLLPTLRVARDLEWTRHELSERLEDLEKLDEQRLTVVAHIYAQKRKQKQFFDSHLLTKIFKKGDLVLVYSLKQHIPKFKKKGNGPFVIEDVSPSGAVKLSTLDGEPMANWISGCRLKKYYLPLTNKLLEKMHAAKQRRIKKQQIIEEAQQEARIRVHKRKAALRNHQFAVPINNLMTRKQLEVPSTDAVSTDDEWQDSMDLRITIKLKDHNINALVDTGARMNAVSYSTYRKATDQPLQPGVIAVKGCNKEMTPALGLINLNVLVNGFPCPHQFICIPDEHMNESLILGISWMRTYKAVPDWDKNHLKLSLKGGQLVIPIAPSMADNLPPAPEQNTWDSAHGVSSRKTRSTKRTRVIIEESDDDEEEQSAETHPQPADSQESSDNAEKRARRREMMKTIVAARQEEPAQKKARHVREKEAYERRHQSA